MNSQHSMSEHNWTSVGQYTSYVSALVVSRHLSEQGVPNRIWSPPRSGGECYIWASPHSADDAKGIPAEPPACEAELTALALKGPPPDNFETIERKQTNPAFGTLGPTRQSMQLGAGVNAFVWALL